MPSLFAEKHTSDTFWILVLVALPVQACATDDSDKQLYTPAVEGLVKLLRSSSARAHEQARKRAL